MTRIIFRWITALIFIAAGANHFAHPAMYARIIPPGFPSPAMLVLISGICEIAGGVGLLIPPLRSAAAWGLIALLIAVFPANLYMAIKPDRFADLHLPYWTLLLRLPLQGVLIAWVWWVR
jgi:uncharacterized membrane protein